MKSFMIAVGVAVGFSELTVQPRSAGSASDPAARPFVSPGPPSCDATWKAHWDFVRSEQSALEVMDAAENRVTGAYAGRKKAAMLAAGAVWGKNWFPADGRKHTMCGRVSTFNIFDPAISGKETDFHIFLDLSPRFAYALDDLANVTPAKEFYGEITLPKPLRNGARWFQKASQNPFGSSPSVAIPLDEPACVYGAWVMEEAHDMQPEIHPMEQFWFRDRAALHWVAALDSSDRFDKAADYCGITTPKNLCADEMKQAVKFIPWAYPRKDAVARVPFIARQIPASITATVGATSVSASVDPDGTQHVSSSPDILIRPVETCADGGSLLGYFELSLQLGPKLYGHATLSGDAVSDGSVGKPASGHIRKGPGLNQPARIAETKVTRSGGQYRAPTFDATEKSVPSPPVALRVLTSVDDVKVDEHSLEIDISPDYIDPSGNDDNPLAQFLTGALYGALPGVGPDSDLTPAHLNLARGRFAQAFGSADACFQPRATASLDGKEVPVLGKGNCDSMQGLRVCVKESPCGVQLDGDLVDYKVLAADATGSFSLRGQVTDPAGMVASFSMTLALPIQEKPPVDGLVAPVIAEAMLSEADLGFLNARRPGSGATADADSQSLACNAKDRAARNFWMLASTFTRHGSLDAAANARLQSVLIRFKSAQTECVPKG